MEAIRCELGSVDVTRLARVSYRQLDYWCRTNVLPAPKVPAKGTGTERVFGFIDVIRVRLVARLRDEGVSLQAIRKVLSVLDKEWGERDPLASGKLLAIDGAVFYEPTSDELWNVLARRRAIKELVTLDVGELARDTAQRVRAFCTA